MAADAASFFETFFRELGKRGIPYVILHGYEQLPEQMPSDIDFAVRHEDLPKLLTIQREIATRHGWVLASVVHAKLSAQYSVLTDPDDPRRFIQLDACGHYVERGCFVLRDMQLLGGCRPHKFFNVPAPASEFGYVLTKALLKQKPLEPYLPRLRELWKAEPQGAEALFKQLMGTSVGGLESWFVRPAIEWERELPQWIRAQTSFSLLNRCRELARAVRRVLRPSGLHIVILGPDGVGKSTLISQLTLSCFHGAKQFHFRPGVLGKKTQGPITQPHAQPPRSHLFGLAKTLYYFADHWLGYLGRTFPAKVRRELVIFDRSFEDIIVDPRRYRLARSGSLACVLSKLLPSPDLTFILDAEPELVHARKPELEIEELCRQREVLRRLAAKTPRCFVIPAAQSPEQVALAVQREIIQFMADREKSRHSG